MTVNEAISLQKAVKGRVAELKMLRSEVSAQKETNWYGERDKTEKIEPQYDVKTVDAKIVEIEVFLYKIDAAIKQSNAATQLDMEANLESLLAPLQ